MIRPAVRSIFCFGKQKDAAAIGAKFQMICFVGSFLSNTDKTQMPQIVADFSTRRK